MTDNTPITYREPAWALFDLDLNAVLTTQYGNLAIFNVKAMAEAWAQKSTRNIEVRAVRIQPDPMLCLTN